MSEHSDESWKRLLLSAEERAILAEERRKAEEERAARLEQEVSRLRQVWNHWKGAVLMVFEDAPKEIFDEGLSRRIKRAGKV